MKKLNILTLSVVLILSCIIRTANCTDITKRRENHPFSKQTSPKKVDTTQIQTTREHPPDYDLPEQRHINPDQLLKDLSSKLGVKPTHQTGDNNNVKTRDELLVFLNSHGTNPDAILFNSASNSNSSILTILTLMGLPNNFNNLSVIQIVSKVGLSALLWGNPIVGAVGSAALSLAFKQLNNGLEPGDMEKNVNAIYNDLYSQNNTISDEFLKLNNISQRANDVDNLKMSLEEFQESVNLAIITKRSLKMLALRLENLEFEEDIDNQQNIFKNYKAATPIQSPLSKQCELRFTSHEQRFNSIVRN